MIGLSRQHTKRVDTVGIKKLVTASVAVAVTLSFQGCGVMFGGTTETIRVSSSPAPARLTTEPTTGTFSTPASLELQRKNSYVLTASLDGYRPAELQIRQEMRTGPLVLDILLTGLIGVVVDALTGGWWNLEPDDSNLVLERVATTGVGPDRIEVRVSVDSERGTLGVESDVPGVQLQIRQRP